MKILFLSDNFPPEVNAPATRTMAHCKEWVKQGHQVTVVTGYPNFPQGKIYPGYRQKWKSLEEIEGIKVVRVWTYMAKNSGSFRRTLDYLSFGLTSFLGSLTLKADLIVATSPQLFTAISGRLLSLVKRRPWVMEVRDLWPDSILAVGALRASRSFRVLLRIEQMLYRSATKIIVVSNAFKSAIHKKGIAVEKLAVVTNGVDDLFKNNNSDPWPEIARISDSTNLRIGYVGTHGMAHGLDIILLAAEQLDESGIHFFLVGDGAAKANLLEEKIKRKISNVHFFDQVGRNTVPSVLAAFDLVIVPLKKSPVFKTVIPSKIFESAALLTPIVLGVEGEAAELVSDYNAGICFEPEDVNDLVKVILDLRDDPILIEKLKEGCQKLALAHDRRVHAIKMLSILEDCIKHRNIESVDVSSEVHH